MPGKTKGFPAARGEPLTCVRGAQKDPGTTFRNTCSEESSLLTTLALSLLELKTQLISLELRERNPHLLISLAKWLGGL